MIHLSNALLIACTMVCKCSYLCPFGLFGLHETCHKLLLLCCGTQPWLTNEKVIIFFASSDQPPYKFPRKSLFIHAHCMEVKLPMWRGSLILWLYVFQDSLASSILSLHKKTNKQAAVFVCTLSDLNPATSSIGPDLIDWLLVLLFVPIDSFISSICSIILSTPRPSQNSVNRCCTVHRCPWSGCFAENHPIWFGRELDPLLSSPLLSTPRLLALPFLASPLLLYSPVLSLTPHWLLSLWAKWLPRRLLRRWRSIGPALSCGNGNPSSVTLVSAGLR